MITVHLKPHKEESLLRFHPWVFSGAIRSIQLDADYPHAQPQEGEVVQVVDCKGKILGVGHYQIGSIAVRILTFEKEEIDAKWWKTRIASAYDVRRTLKLTNNPQTTCYRLIHGEAAQHRLQLLPAEPLLLVWPRAGGDVVAHRHLGGGG